MMSEPKPLASLTSGLLARKGGARPAMRRQVVLGHENPALHDDLGWNDMGYDVDPAQGAGVVYHPSGLSPMPTHHTHQEAAGPAAVVAMPGVDEVAAVADAVEPVVVEQRRKVQALANTQPPANPVAKSAKTPRPRAEVGANGRFAFTLRLDAHRHLMLRLSSAATNRSAQQILVKLVDDYFATQPAVAAMAAQIGPDQVEGKDA